MFRFFFSWHGRTWHGSAGLSAQVPTTGTILNNKALPSMGAQICQPNCKMSVLVVEGLKKSELATPPSTRSTTKSKHHRAWECQFVSPVHNKHFGRRGVEQVGISNATEHEKQQQKLAPPSMGAHILFFLKTPRQIRATNLNHHPRQMLENKGLQNKWRWSTHGHSAKRGCALGVVFVGGGDVHS